MRVVLHAHSDWSYDGHWSLHRIARVYGALGVAAVMMTEHDTGFDPARFGAYRAECAAASIQACTLIPGIEYSCPDNDVHILTWGLDRFLAEHRSVPETLAAVRAAGGAAVFAHPVRRDAWRIFDPAWVPYLSGIEVWNRKSNGVTACGRADALIRGTGLPATVGQDFHKLRHLYPLTMQVPRPTGDLEAGLVAALRAGRMVPQAFGRPILNATGALDCGTHDRLERARRGLRDLIRGRSGSEKGN